MKQSVLFSRTRREAPADEVSKNAQLLIRAGFIHKEMAGVYSFLPLGLRTLNKIIDIIREEMNALGGQEVLLSALQDPTPWKKTLRWDEQAVDSWFKTEFKNGGETGLAFTHEEPITALVREHLSSYKDLPAYLYQFQTKFRNETRARSGIIRTREFIMKDLYSFSRTEAEHEEFYKKITAAYQRIFERIGIGAHTLLTYASGGSFSRFSHEFQTRTAVGEDTIHICSKCNIAVNHEISAEHPTCPQCSNELAEERAVEVGNIFTLGTRFSDALGLRFRDEKGVERSVFMGSYGIGPARLLGVIAELLSDEKGLVLPTHLAPYRVHLLALPGARGANALEGKLEKSGVDVLHDDRACAAGEKFADADLIGLPIRAVLSAKIPTGKVEIKERTASTPRIISHTELLRYV